MLTFSHICFEWLYCLITRAGFPATTEYGGTFLDNNTKLNDVIEYLKKYNFHKFSYLSQNRCVPIEEVKRINVNPQARRHGYPSVVEITGDYIPDHYNYSNIVCINKAANLDSLF